MVALWLVLWQTYPSATVSIRPYLFPDSSESDGKSNDEGGWMSIVSDGSAFSNLAPSAILLPAHRFTTIAAEQIFLSVSDAALVGTFARSRPWEFRSWLWRQHLAYYSIPISPLIQTFLIDDDPDTLQAVQGLLRLRFRMPESTPVLTPNRPCNPSKPPTMTRSSVMYGCRA